MSLSVSLQHTFDNFALDASFDAPGGVTVLYGRSGSGKTTIVNALAGLMTPNGGHVRAGKWAMFDSVRGINLPPHKRRIGYIFQDARLFPHLTVRQNLLYGRWFAPKPNGGANEGDVVDMLGIGALLDRRPGTLSGGEKQRVAIGRALLAQPQLILADEPLAALDDARKEEILPYFERLRDHLDIPVIYVSHAGYEVARLATTLVILDAGRVTAQGPADDLLSDPNVTPLGAAEAGVVLHATVAAQHPDGLTEIATGNLRLLLPRVPQTLGTALRVRIKAQDIMLATEEPRNVSALNVLPATVTAIRLGVGPGALVQLLTGETHLLARVTQRSVDGLNLRVGSQVFAVLKAVSVPRAAIGDETAG